MADDRTVAALSSGLVPSGVAVVRVSGPQVRFALERIAGRVPKARYAERATLCDPATGQALDDALILFFPKPNSFTGDDVAEFHCHGGRAVVQGLLAALYALPGIAPAEAGAFTRQAFLNGKMDLTQVEAVGDLIHATTDAQREQAMGQLAGRARDRVLAWRDAITDMRALVEADLDFSDEDDVPGSVVDSLPERLDGLIAELERNVQDRWSERLRDGFRVVLAGAPNSGKSTLLNALVERDAALVSSEAGTTRDVIDVAIDMDGLPVVLSDTAGLRVLDDRVSAVERMGIGKTQDLLDSADCVVWLSGGDAGQDAQHDFSDTLRESWIRIRSKCDHPGSPDEAFDPDLLPVSGRTGAGLPALRSRIAESIRERYQNVVVRKDQAVALNARRREALVSCLRSLGAARHLLRGPVPSLDMVAEELRVASHALGTITGHVDSEAVLDRLFARFCIGK